MSTLDFSQGEEGGMGLAQGDQLVTQGPSHYLITNLKKQSIEGHGLELVGEVRLVAGLGFPRHSYTRLRRVSNWLVRYDLWLRLVLI